MLYQIAAGGPKIDEQKYFQALIRKQLTRTFLYLWKGMHGGKQRFYTGKDDLSCQKVFTCWMLHLFSTQNAMVPQSSQCFSLCAVKGGHEHVVQNVK